MRELTSSNLIVVAAFAGSHTSIMLNADCWMRNIGDTSLQIVGGRPVEPPRAALINPEVKFQLIKYSVITLTCRNLCGCG